MWFKNLFLYRLNAQWNANLEEFNQQLNQVKFSACSALQTQSIGFIPPVKNKEITHKDNNNENNANNNNNNNIENLVYSVSVKNNQQFWLIAVATEQRLLPASVVKQEIEERSEKIYEEQGYYPSRRALKELKEQIIAEFLPRAFTRKKITYAWFDIKNKWFIIDAASPSKADELVGVLADALEDFPLQPVYTEKSAVSVMTECLLSGGIADENLAEIFTLDRDCELKSPTEERQTVRYVRHPLEGKEIAAEIKSHLKSGKLPTRLAFTFDNRISFVLTDKAEIKRIVYLDSILAESQHNAESATDESERFNADFSLMSLELSKFIPSLMSLLGGEKVKNKRNKK